MMMNQKITFLSIFLFAISYCAKAQLNKKTIDYQYSRDNKTYYAYELFKYSDDPENQLQLNFTLNTNFKTIDKIVLLDADKEIKVKFKQRSEVIKSDNPEQRFYPVVIDQKELQEKGISCSAQIVFKLDNGSTYSLPFNICNAIAAKN